MVVFQSQKCVMNIFTHMKLSYTYRLFALCLRRLNIPAIDHYIQGRELYSFFLAPCSVPVWKGGGRAVNAEQRPETHKMNEIVTSLTLVGNLSQLPPTIQVNENLSAPGFCQQAFILSISLMIFSNFRHGYQINRGDFLSKGS